MTTDSLVSLATVGALPEVHREQLKVLARPWFNRDVTTAEEFFELLGELYGEAPDDMDLYLEHIVADDDPELVLYDYWNDPGSGTGNYFYAGTADETGGYEVQHYHEGTPLEETAGEARARALARRSG